MRIFCDWFDAAKIEQSGQCFRWKRIDADTYTIPAFETLLTLRQISKEELYLSCSESDYAALWHDYFDLGFDYRRFTERAVLRVGSDYLAQAAQTACGVRILRQELWETTVSFIISANNNIPRIKKILALLCECFDGFPKPAQLLSASDETLRLCGTGYRDKYLRSAGAFFLEGNAQRLSALGYEDAHHALRQIAGIGPKVADCICLFALGHKDAFPRDVWIRRIEQAHFGGCFPLALAPEGAGILQQYLFYHERML